MSIYYGGDKAAEYVFQNDIIRQMLANGWKLGKPENYNRELALYEEDLLGFIQNTQDEQWQKFCSVDPSNPEQKILEKIASQLNKADPNAANKKLRTFGTLGALRHEIKDHGARFRLCEFKPEHDLNPDTLADIGDSGIAFAFYKKTPRKTARLLAT